MVNYEGGAPADRARGAMSGVIEKHKKSAYIFDLSTFPLLSPPTIG
ncbi:MAG TPA: hypothetical protein VKK79_05605 [Candidatus Lokiarchaeia archaeon]|nr:hypothetical protein [Candidatus Lokiarchaeia archaeon]